MTFHEPIMEFLSKLAEQIASSPDFQTIGIIFLFFWTIIPSVKSIIPEFFSGILLASGVAPLILIVVSALGATIGDYLLYMLGRGSFRLFKGRHREMAKADHLLHKYRLPIFLATPFLSIVGDIVVFLAGYERIGFHRILPYILVGQFLRMSLGMIALMGIIQLPNFFGI